MTTRPARRLLARLVIVYAGLAALGPLAAEAVPTPGPSPSCPGPGVSGDRADVRGIRFRARRPVGMVALGLAGEVAGTYQFDAELRQSEGFVVPLEAGRADLTVNLPVASTPPYPTVLVTLPIFLDSPVNEGIFSFRLAAPSGPGLLFFETHGAGSQGLCPDVEGTDENDVASPTVRGDPAGLRVLAELLAVCESDGSGRTTAADHGIHFTALGRRFETIGVGLRATLPGVYGFAAQVRRSRGFSSPPERGVEVATTLADSIDTHPYPMTFLDFEPIEVLTEDERFTVRIIQIAGPLGGIAYVEQGPGCTAAVTTVDASSTDPAAQAPASNFVVAVPEPSGVALGTAALASIGLAALRRADRRIARGSEKGRHQGVSSLRRVVRGPTLGISAVIALLPLGAIAAGLGTGPVVAWGDNSGSMSTPPASVNGVAGTAEAIAAGGGHSCAIQAETGAVVCWGIDYSGETTPPASVDGTSGSARAIAAGIGFSCAIREDTGGVVCWGLDNAGQRDVPAAVDGTLGSATAIAAGWNHACAIQAISGAVVCWGQNNNGEATPPGSVNGTAGSATAVAAGGAHSCAVRTQNGAVICWGNDSDGQATPPAAVDGAAGAATAIAAGFLHTCAIHAASGGVLCWGSDFWGQSRTPRVVFARAIAVRQFHSCAIESTDGGVVCWGDDSFGMSTPPASVDGTAGSAIAIAAGNQHTLAIRAPEPATAASGVLALCATALLARRRPSGGARRDRSVHEKRGEA